MKSIFNSGWQPEIAELHVHHRHGTNAEVYTAATDRHRRAQSADHLIQYSHEDPPVFVGHYWMDAEPTILAPNVACLDYSVASKSGGKLVAYRWDGEQVLSDENFVFVERPASHS